MLRLVRITKRFTSQMPQKNIIDTLENEIDTLRTDIIKNNETIKSLKKEISAVSYATYIALGFSVGSMFSKH